jgi:hypothetical protein
MYANSINKKEIITDNGRRWVPENNSLAILKVSPYLGINGELANSKLEMVGTNIEIL